MNQAELFFPQPLHQVQIGTTPQEQSEDEALFVFENAEPEPRVAYTARLLDYPAVDAVRVAEQRFRRELDKQLGGEVVLALRAFQNASESGESDLTKAEIALAVRWAKAYDVSRTAGFRDLGDTDEAYFEVRPIRLSAKPAHSRDNGTNDIIGSVVAFADAASPRDGFCGARHARADEATSSAKSKPVPPKTRHVARTIGSTSPTPFAGLEGNDRQSAALAADSARAGISRATMNAKASSARRAAVKIAVRSPRSTCSQASI